MHSPLAVSYTHLDVYKRQVLNILLSLDILSDYDPNTRVEETTQVKIKKKDRVHLSKKERKARKEMKQIEEEMRKAEQAVSAEERERNQAEILKFVLSLYLNILKSDTTRLVGSVLEGLSKLDVYKRQLQSFGCRSLNYGRANRLSVFTAL